MRRATFILLGSLVLGACAQRRAWQAELDDTLPLLGHRNWIAVVDSAYPLQTAPGLRVVYAAGDTLDVVEAVLGQVDASGHVRATVFLDRELEAVSERDAPGISGYRAGLDRLLAGREVQRLPHEEVLSRLDAAGREFAVLVLKTPLELPYTSVFVRLDCGYWSDAAETRLRASLGAM
jgi:hypothetical protein